MLQSSIWSPVFRGKAKDRQSSSAAPQTELVNRRFSFAANYYSPLDRQRADGFESSLEDLAQIKTDSVLSSEFLASPSAASSSSSPWPESSLFFQPGHMPRPASSVWVAPIQPLPLPESCPMRLIRIFNLPRNIDELSLIFEFCKACGEVAAINKSEVEMAGYAYVLYFDLRHAVRAHSGLNQLKFPQFACLQLEYVPDAEFPRLVRSGFDILASHTSKIIVSVQEGYLTNSDVEQLAQMSGAVRSVVTSNKSSSMPMFVCEFYDVRAAKQFSTKGINISGIVAKISLLSPLPSLFNGYPHEPTNNTPNSSGSSSSGHAIDRVSTTSTTPIDVLLGKWNINDTWRSPLVDKVSSDNLKNAFLGSSVSSIVKEKKNKDEIEELGVATRANVPKNNAVDLRRIAKGLDTRTTLMLRNIPNKVDQDMLKEYIDLTNKNTYDFLYFANKCKYVLKSRTNGSQLNSVGYAFISFIHPEDIITFAKARCGTKW